MMSVERKLENVAANMSTTEGRVDMTAATDMDLVVSVPESQCPDQEGQVSLRLVGDDCRASVRLDLEEVDELVQDLERGADALLFG